MQKTKTSQYNFLYAPCNFPTKGVQLNIIHSMWLRHSNVCIFHKLMDNFVTQLSMQEDENWKSSKKRKFDQSLRKIKNGEEEEEEDSCRLSLSLSLHHPCGQRSSTSASTNEAISSYSDCNYWNSFSEKHSLNLDLSIALS